MVGKAFVTEKRFLCFSSMKWTRWVGTKNLVPAMADDEYEGKETILVL